MTQSRRPQGTKKQESHKKENELDFTEIKTSALCTKKMKGKRQNGRKFAALLSEKGFIKNHKVVPRLNTTKRKRGVETPPKRTYEWSTSTREILITGLQENAT